MTDPVCMNGYETAKALLLERYPEGFLAVDKEKPIGAELIDFLRAEHSAPLRIPAYLLSSSVYDRFSRHLSQEEKNFVVGDVSLIDGLRIMAEELYEMHLASEGFKLVPTLNMSPAKLRPLLDAIVPNPQGDIVIGTHLLKELGLDVVAWRASKFVTRVPTDSGESFKLHPDMAAELRDFVSEYLDMDSPVRQKAAEILAIREQIQSGATNIAPFKRH